MLKLETSKKAFAGVVAVTTTKKVKDLRSEAVALLDKEAFDTFKDVTLSKAFKDYCKTLLVANLVKSLQTEFVKTNTNEYKELDITFDEKMEIAQYFRNVANVATFEGRQEIKEATKGVEVHLLSHLTSNDYVILDTDFTSVSKELKLSLRSARNNTLNEFNHLALMLYATQLSNKKAKEVKDTVIKSFNEVLNKRSFNSLHEQGIDTTNNQIMLVEMAGKKVNMKNLTAQLIASQNKSYVIVPKVLQDLRNQEQAH